MLDYSRGRDQLKGTYLTDLRALTVWTTQAADAPLRVCKQSKPKPRLLLTRDAQALRAGDSYGCVNPLLLPGGGYGCGMRSLQGKGLIWLLGAHPLSDGFVGDLVGDYSLSFVCTLLPALPTRG